jgi:hypothetical protein
VKAAPIGPQAREAAALAKRTVRRRIEAAARSPLEVQGSAQVHEGDLLLLACEAHRARVWEGTPTQHRATRPESETHPASHTGTLCSERQGNC